MGSDFVARELYVIGCADWTDALTSPPERPPILNYHKPKGVKRNTLRYWIWVVAYIIYGSLLAAIVLMILAPFLRQLGIF